MHISNKLNPEKLAVSQHEYSNGKFTETELSSAVAEVKNSVKVKTYTLVAFLDIEDAFNNIQSKATTEPA